MLQGKRLVLFDMDGTLIDSVGMWNKVDRALLRELGAPDAEAVDIQYRRDTLLRRFSKAANPYQEYCRFLGETYHSPLEADAIMEKRYAIAADYLVNQVDYKPDAEKLLRRLKAMGIPLGIASTTKRSNMDIYRTRNRNLLAKAPLDDYFSFIYTREDAKEIKPHPEIYHRILGEQHLSPADCLIFEDSLIGVEAANSAGIEVAVLYDRYSDGEREEIRRRADYLFDSFADVLEAINKET